ncbi:G2/M phase-specific E3 ubiquitin-protein ligase [Larimichthys crocea]|uniref:G2/M phase-specific E3 ubiquitin-protein ligase n=2 Tax=Larimichthys crocea TaxID=215358 RepID=A0A6G0IDY5_LARCR|nr:G2/M phase-specific E3 ubiquitin-protein ligase isoform X1 [Larimichthys crocea]KAE8289557.1 G2/M phase-specific E3 ubiquitin-protein ligase [Larimichthys crocea]TMS21692.1 G2/M phase-specific E3 ubiquitin-protein ligase [Larimichthys crocea]
MKKKARRSLVADSGGNKEQCCVLCRLSDDDPAMFGEKVTLKEHKLSVHYFCLLTSCGVYQRGEEGEGVFGFLVDDIKQEIRRSSRLTCCCCKKKGACVGCNVRSCRKTIHFPCGRKQQFISQFTGLFPSFCPDHSPTQSLCVASDLSLPQTCSICLDSIEPILCYSILKCPSCHTSWFHRDCVQRQAHSAGLFFFRCTLCNNKESFQEEMLRMGIYIPERDASWELEANAYSELLEVYQRCDAFTCLCNNGRTHSAKSGWFELIRCRLCGSGGTHRKCSGLELDTNNWACSDCTQATDRRASLVASPQGGQSLLSKRNISPIHSPISCKRPSVSVRSGSSEELLQALASQLRPLSVQVEVSKGAALSAGVALVRRADFDPTHTLSVRFKEKRRTSFPSSLQDSNMAKQYFLKLLVQQIQDSVVFEGPDGSKNLALNSQALREDLYFDVGCLLALALVHGGPPVGFFSRALYQSLFNYPPNQPLTVAYMTPDTPLTRQVNRITKAKSLNELKKVMAANWQYLELAGCNRPINRLEEREALVEDLVSFTLITRVQLPLQRFREGLQTLGVFDQVQLFPSAFYSVFCKVDVRLTARSLGQLFSVNHSQQEDRLKREMPVVTFWRHFLLECEVGRSSISLQDLLRFVTEADEFPAAGFLPSPSISFLHPVISSPPEAEQEEEEEEDEEEGAGRPGREVWSDEGLFPQRDTTSKHLLLPVTSSYQAFKSSMEQVVSHHVHLLPTER